HFGLRARPHEREFRTVERCSVFEFEFGEWRRGTAVALDELGPIADPAEGDGAAAIGCGVSGRAVERPEVERDDIARLHRPGADLKLSFASGHVGNAFALVASVEAGAVETLGP